MVKSVERLFCFISAAVFQPQLTFSFDSCFCFSLDVIQCFNFDKEFSSSFHCYHLFIAHCALLAISNTSDSFKHTHTLTRSHAFIYIQLFACNWIRMFPSAKKFTWKMTVIAFFFRRCHVDEGKRKWMNEHQLTNAMIQQSQLKSMRVIRRISL